MNALYSLSQPRRAGRPPACPMAIVAHVIELRLQGLSYAEISAELNHEGIPTPAGRLLWQKSYVDRLLHTQYAREMWGQLGNAV